MNRLLLCYVPIFLSILWIPVNSRIYHHACSVTIDPKSHEISVIDTLVLPKPPGTSIQFQLNRGLSIKRAPGDYRYSDIQPDESNELPVSRLVTLVSDKPLPSPIVIEYHGAIRDTLHEAENYARGFATTSGIIDTAGVFLSGGTYWLPAIEDSLFTFSITVNLPPGWMSVSQGQRYESGDTERWVCRQPMEEAYLVAGKYLLSRMPCGDVESEIYLFAPDSGLAASYHTATCRYLDMYSEIIGAYPYPKFALVENFWQTGYGMPSFTLLGGIVIRLPFIIHTSYGHEILHNWWGNGVYVDWEKGNWCEGITSYMADHYYKELRGQDSEHRQKILLHYLWYASNTEDIPLTQFSERHSSNTEAVGYGKSAMVFHMIRRMIGDELFYMSLQSFWNEFQFKKASWNDIVHAFEEESGVSLDTFVTQWIERPGAPGIHVSHVSLSDGDLRISLEQDDPLYDLKIPVEISYSANGSDSVSAHSIAMHGTTVDTILACVGSPSAVGIDPNYDIFRIVDAKEAPPGFGHLFSRDSVYVHSAIDSVRTGAIAGNFPVTCVIDRVPQSLSEPTETGYLTLIDWSHIPHELSAQERRIIDLCELGDISSGSNQVLLIASITDGDDPQCTIAVGEQITDSTIHAVLRKLVHYDTYTLLVFTNDRCTGKYRVNPNVNPMHVTLTKE